jgi:hypothetical protein
VEIEKERHFSVGRILIKMQPNMLTFKESIGNKEE